MNGMHFWLCIATVGVANLATRAALPLAGG